MRLPTFLIIGAMKAGTTSLYRDLLTNRDIFMPLDKEPESLCHDDVLTDAGRAAYARLFRRAKAHQRCGEASTAYTKRPDIDGVAARARRVLGPDLRVIYLVRDPVARIVSHHHHEVSVGRASLDINAEVRRHPMYINYSLYAMQLEPWVAAFGRENVRVVRFEEYVRARAATVADLCRFIGVVPRPELIDEGRVFNKSDSRRVAPRPLRNLHLNPLYRHLLRPLLPLSLKDRVREWLFPPGPSRPPPPSDETVALIRERTSADQERLEEFIVRSAQLEPTAT